MSFSMITWKQNMAKKQKLCYMDTGSFTLYIKTDNTDMNITGDFETKFDTLNYKLGKSLSNKSTKMLLD